jgi:hypothetical protein
MSDPLFIVTSPEVAHPGLHGPIRLALDGRMAQLEGRDWEPDLVLLVQVLADRVDQAVAMRDRRGFVQLTAEYRAARVDLMGAGDDGTDALDAAIAAFTASESGHAQGPVPAD